MRGERLCLLIIVMMLGFAAAGSLSLTVAAVETPVATVASNLRDVRVLLIYNSPEPSGELEVMESLLQHFAVKTETARSSDIGELRWEQYDCLIFFDSIRTSRLDREAVIRAIGQLDIPCMVFNSGAADETFSGITIRYRDEVYPTLPVSVAPAEDGQTGVVLAAISDGRTERPLIVRSGDAWTVYGKLESGLVSWIVADILHDVLGEHHADRTRGLYVVEHVNPLTPPEQLRKLADLLASRGIPYVIIVEPVLRSSEDDRLHTAGDDREWIAALRYMVEAGGTIVLDGSGLEGLEPEEIAYRIDQGIAFLYEIGVYPIALYASRDVVLRLESAPEHASFTTTLEYSKLRLDGSRYTDIPYDHIAAPDRIMYPVSLGSAASDAAAAQLITRARTLMLVRDAWLVVGLDASQPYELLESMVEQFGREPIMWTDIRYDVHLLDAGFLQVATGGDGLLEVRMLDKTRAAELVKVQLSTYKFGTVTYYSTWILVMVVGGFVVLFVLFVVMMRYRRRRRLFSEKELE